VTAESAERRQRQTQSEMDIARNVQQKLLPQTFRQMASLEYSALCLPAREVGGDYYDFFHLEEDRIAGLLADVSGKGVAAAMLMANLRACLAAVGCPRAFAQNRWPQGAWLRPLDRRYPRLSSPQSEW
jgi:serine phosphatase RsbU (regulator of sigma subunit)